MMAKGNDLSLVIIGAIWHSLSIENVEFLPLHVVGISIDGRIDIFSSVESSGSRQESIDKTIENIKNCYSVEKVKQSFK
jgi:hypothetical protein